MPGEITELLAQLRAGDTTAESRLAALVYDELYRMAERHMRRERPGHSLQATALVHDAYLRLVQQDQQNWQNRAHFFAVAAKLMRQILIDHARKHRALKRGGPGDKLPLDDVVLISNDRLEEILAVDEALTRLARRDERLARVVELRFFGGLTEDEIAEALEISARTVKRDWAVAKAWLYGELFGGGDDADAVGAR